jgi:hypothetical protein
MQHHCQHFRHTYHRQAENCSSERSCIGARCTQHRVLRFSALDPSTGNKQSNKGFGFSCFLDDNSNTHSVVYLLPNRIDSIPVWQPMPRLSKGILQALLYQITATCAKWTNKRCRSAPHVACCIVLNSWLDAARRRPHKHQQPAEPFAKKDLGR